MDKYDKIYVPATPGWKTAFQCNYKLTDTSKEMMAQKISPLMLKETEGPVIVLTIEELKILWDAARLYESEALRKPYANREMLKEPDFTAYLSSKGIKQ